MTQRVRIEVLLQDSAEPVLVQTYGGDVLLTRKVLRPGEAGDFYVWSGQSLGLTVLAE